MKFLAGYSGYGVGLKTCMMYVHRSGKGHNEQPSRSQRSSAPTLVIIRSACGFGGDIRGSWSHHLGYVIRFSDLVGERICYTCYGSYNRRQTLRPWIWTAEMMGIAVVFIIVIFGCAIVEGMSRQ